MTKTVIFTGGGSGGHVVPALSLLAELQKAGAFQIRYVGSHEGIERRLVGEYASAHAEIPYQGISTGKLRRYFSWQNFTDIVRVFWGFCQAFRFLLPFPRGATLVFSTGGFVSVPVVLAAWMQGKPVFIHEQTSRVGLANQICSRFATRVFVSFRESLGFFPAAKTEYSGYPLRTACFEEGFRPILVGGKPVVIDDRPLMFVTGGGNGSRLLNDLIRNNLEWLRERLRIVHQVGGQFFEEFRPLGGENYIVADFVNDSFLDLLKASQVVLSRAGAGTVCELLAIGRRSIFIPLKIAQKDEQYHNALEAEKLLGSIVITEDSLTDDTFRRAVDDLLRRPDRVRTDFPNGLTVLVNAVNEWFASGRYPG
jgi:UDP-N-acetylglucosamine--N-acetylmuramyl-(pentapeptide) pyrophosphoryl-undecaprenol N-acetylglucosamine transferase